MKHLDLIIPSRARTESEALGRIRERLAVLHSTASTEPPTDETENHMLHELLRAVRLEAERAIDSRPSTANSIAMLAAERDAHAAELQ